MKKNVLSILLMTTVVLLFAGSAFGLTTAELADSVYISADNSVDSTTTVLPQYNVYVDADYFAVDDTLLIEPPTGFSFDTSATVNAVLSGTGGLGLVDSTVKPLSYGKLKFVVDSVKAATADSIFLSGITIFPIVTNTTAAYDSSTTDVLVANKVVPGVGATAIGDDPGYGEIIYLPGVADELVWTTPIPNSPVDAGAANIGNLLLEDQFGNTTTDRTTAVTLSAVLNGTTTPGNGTLTWDSKPGTGLHGGERAYSAIKYTRAEVIQLVASATGLTSVTNANAITVKAAAPAHITANYSKTTLTIDETTSIDIAVTDEYYNAVDNFEPINIAEVQGGGGTFDPASGFNLDADGKKTVVYTPSKFYTGTVKIKISYSADVVHNKTITVNPGALGNVAITPATVSDTVGTHTAFEIELLDTYGNHIDATATSEVAITQGTDDEGAWTTTLNSATGKIEVDYTVGTTSGEDDDLFVETVEGNFTDSAVITKLSGPPATMKFYSLGDSVFVAGDGLTETLVDSVWDAYGNLSDGYDLTFTTSGDGVFDAETFTLVNGKATNTFRADSLAGDQTLTVSYGDVSASFDVKVYPNVITKVVLSADPVSLVAGQGTILTLKAYDAYGVGGAGNHTITSDSMFASIIAAFAFQDSAGTPTGPVGKGTPGTVDTSAAGDYIFDYTAYEMGPDSARIVATLDGVMDTIVILSGANAPLGSFAIVVTDSSVVAGSNIEIKITAKDELGITKHDYTGNVKIKLEGSAAESVDWTGDYDTTGFDVVLPAPFSAGTLTLYLKDIVAETGLVFSIEDTATGISKTYSGLDFYPGDVDSLVLEVLTAEIYANEPFNYSVTPIDVYGNVNTTQQINFWLTAKDPDAVNIAANKRYITGPTTYENVATKPYTGQYLQYYDAKIGDAYIDKPLGVSATFDILAARVEVTFEVDMSVQVLLGNFNIASDIVDIAGSFNDWGGNAMVLDDADGDTVYSITVAGFQTGQSIEYKFRINSNWDTSEFPDGGPNRVYIVPATNSVVRHWYDDKDRSVLGIDDAYAIPKEFALHQNYPNPFNPMTTIKYELPKESFVTIAIYDLMGNKVRDLVNQNQNAGYQTAIWNATDNYGRKVSSGYYIYIMDTEGFHKTQKMILLK